MKYLWILLPLVLLWVSAYALQYLPPVGDFRWWAYPYLMTWLIPPFAGLGVALHKILEGEQ